jgi:hypothetical protein
VPSVGGMLTVSSGSSTVNATYDALGGMVEQQRGSSFTEILYSPIGKTALLNGQTLTKAFIPLPGGATAVYNSSGLAYYRHSDWLGSSRLASTQTRGLFSSIAYAPFGEQYGSAGTADASFTAGPLGAFQIGLASGSSWNGLYVEGHIGPVASGGRGICVRREVSCARPHRFSISWESRSFGVYLLFIIRLGTVRFVCVQAQAATWNQNATE